MDLNGPCGNVIIQRARASAPRYCMHYGSMKRGLMRGKRGRDGHEGEDEGAEKRRRVGDG